MKAANGRWPLAELAQTMGPFYEKTNTYSVDARGLADPMPTVPSNTSAPDSIT